jgi:hypothetical protein
VSGSAQITWSRAPPKLAPVEVEHITAEGEFHVAPRPSDGRFLPGANLHSGGEQAQRLREALQRVIAAIIEAQPGAGD